MAERLLGYCTNVHAGATLAETKQNLETHAAAVRRIVSPDAPMPVGLWLAAPAAATLLADDGVDEFKAFLVEHGLRPFTLNGFPYGDFHQRVVKHTVYEPDWAQEARTDYTLRLARILARWLDEGEEGSISTLPIAWGAGATDETLEAAAAQLRRLADALARIESEHGVLIHVDLEPEPGCVLQRHADVASFYTERLLSGADEERIRRHVRVCHDVCHAAVMFDPQRAAFEMLQALGIRIGKVQISNAVRVDFGARTPRQRADALAQLRGFAEDRYLHQTTIRTHGDDRFVEDLPQALAEHADAGGEWRVHFHVPVDLDSFGLIDTTQSWIDDCLAHIGPCGVSHFEVETYAWNVLPEALRVPTLADGIAREMQWVAERMA